MREARQRLEIERVRQDADAIRHRCRTFAGFVKEAWHILEPSNPLVWGWHMDCICEHLQAAIEGRIRRRLACNIPPGSSKSLLFSVLLQAYLWGPGGRPDLRMVSTSFALRNVTRDTRKTRDLIMSDWYQALWPMPLIRAGETSFANAQTGTREGVPFTSLVGQRGDLLVVDDPHSLDGAESELDREKAVRRFMERGQFGVNDLVNSYIFVVMQRIHESDLTGAILAREMGYEHIMIPMEYEPERQCITSLGWKDPRSYEGELMDPARMPRQEIELIKKDNDYAWAGQFQQRPAPREGAMFKCAELKHVDNVPDGAVYVRGWDIAGSTRKKSPFTVGFLLAWSRPLLYIVDIERKRAEVHEAESLIVETSRADKIRYGNRVKSSIPQDPGQSGKSQKVHLSNRLAGLEFMFSPETGSKEDRAIPFASMVNAGSVRIVGSAPLWLQAFLNEASMFPGSAYKDQIDAASRAFAELAKLMADDSDDMVYAPIYGHKIQAVR